VVIGRGFFKKNDACGGFVHNCDKGVVFLPAVVDQVYREACSQNYPILPPHTTHFCFPISKPWILNIGIVNKQAIFA